MFVKHGDGKIVAVMKSEEELTEDQKKAAEDLSKEMAVKAEADTSDEKKSEN